MTGPIRALNWEFSRRLSASLPLILAIMLLGPLGVEGLFRIADLPMDEVEITPLSWHCVYLALGFLLMVTPLVEAFRGVHQRIFALPVSNRFIATWTMTLSIVAVVGQEILIHSLYGLLLSDWSLLAIFGNGQSLTGPCQAVFATMVSMLVAIYWSLKRFSFRRLLLCGAVLASLAWWFAGHYYPDGFAGGPQPWIRFSAVDAAVCAGVIVASWIVSLRGIERERCGENVEYSLEKRVDQLANRIRSLIFSDHIRDYRSAERAIAWNQWRHCGRDAALAAGIGFGTILAVLMFNVQGSRRGLEGIVVLLFIIPGVLGFMTGSVIGILAPPNGRIGISTFLAAAPVTDAGLARGLLMNAWKTTLSAWGLTVSIGMLSLIAAIIYRGMDSLTYEINRFQQISEWPFGILILPLALLGSGVLAWMLTATFAVLHWTGNHRLPVTALVGILLWFILLMLLSFVLSEKTVAWLRAASMSIASVAIVCGSVWAFAVALRRNMLKPESVVRLMSVWFGLSVFCWYSMPVPPMNRLFVIGVLMLTVSPVAFAPLAVSGNRHAA